MIFQIYRVPIPPPRSMAASCERSQSHDADILPKVDRLILHQTYTPVHVDQTSQNHIEDTYKSNMIVPFPNRRQKWLHINQTKYR